jgi:hypothetical protein
MRCRSCNEALTDYETTIRSLHTMEYVSMCKQCLKSIKTDLCAVGNVSLMSEADEVEEGTEADLDPLAGIDDFDETILGEIDKLARFLLLKTILIK